MEKQQPEISYYCLFLSSGEGTTEAGRHNLSVQQSFKRRDGKGRLLERLSSNVNRHAKLLEWIGGLRLADSR